MNNEQIDLTGLAESEMSDQFVRPKKPACRCDVACQYQAANSGDNARVDARSVRF